jgi:hypothetical protein
MSSFTISYINPPYTGVDLLNQTAPSNIGAQNNNFSVGQSFQSTIGVAGLATFSSPPVMSGTSIANNSIPALSIVNDSIGDAQISAGGVGQTSVASGYVDLVNAQSIAGTKTFSSAITVDGAIATFNGGVSTSTFSASGSASFNTIQALANISTQSNLTVGGTAAINGAGGLTVSNGVTALQSATCTNLTVSGNLTGTASKVVVASDNTAGTYPLTFTKLANSNLLFCDDTVAPLLNYNPSLGALSTAALSVSGTSTFNNVVLPVTQTVLTIAAGVLALNLNNLSYNEFILPSANFLSNITAITFSNVIVNSKFNIYIQGGAANRTINKNISSGAVSQLNDLAGNTQIGALSTWRCVGTVLTSTLVALDFQNFT